MILNFSADWNDIGGKLVWSNNHQTWLLTETNDSPVFEMNSIQLDALASVIKAAEMEEGFALSLINSGTD